MAEPQGIPDSPIGRKQYDAEHIAITAWRFNDKLGWQFQIIAKDEAMKRSGNGYLILDIAGAAELWRELTQVLRDRGVIA